jgi:hypothetical protein
VFKRGKLKGQLTLVRLQTAAPIAWLLSRLASVTRIHSGQRHMGGSQAGLSGQYDGNAIRASGREKVAGRNYTFVLTMDLSDEVKALPQTRC